MGITGALKTQNRIDEFKYLQDPDLPDVMEYIDKEREYFDAVTDSFKSTTDKIISELSFYSEFDDSADGVDVLPEVIGNYAYFFKDGMYYRQPLSDSLNTRETLDLNKAELLLDTNAFASGSSISAVTVSPDASVLAYIEKQTGEEDGILRFKSLSSERANAELLADLEVPDVVNFVFGQNVDASERLWGIYTKMNMQLRPNTVKFLDLSPNGEVSTRTVWKEEDDRFFVDISKTKDQKFILITSQSRNSSEVRFIPAVTGDPQSLSDKMSIIREKVDGVEYFVDHCGDNFYIVTNGLSKSHDFEVCVAPSDAPHKWIKLLDGQEFKGKLEDVDVFATHVVIYAKNSDGYSTILIYDIKTKSLKDVHCYSSNQKALAVDERICSIMPGINRNFHSKRIRFVKECLGFREIVYEYDLEKKKLDVVRAVRINGFTEKDRNDFVVRQIRVPLNQETSDFLPITLVHKNHVCCLDNLTTVFSTPNDEKTFKNIANKTKRGPVLVHTYNSYGVSPALPFDPQFLPLLNKGFTIAIVHGKGGSEFGKEWYMKGVGSKGKLRAINEVERLLRLLKQEGHPTVGLGISAGGCIVGSLVSKSLNETLKGNPALLDVAILQVPFLDLISSMMDPLAALTTTERLEWGDPLNPEDLSIQMQFAPYDTIPEQGKEQVLMKNLPPSILMTAGWKDLRVPYWHTLKYMARLRSKLPAYYTSENENNPVAILNTRKAAGHFGDTSDATLDDTAQWISFIISELERRQS
jgi:oligopeptidase B